VPIGIHDRIGEAIEELLAQPETNQEPVGIVRTIGGYPDQSQHTVELICRHRDLRDGDLLYLAPPKQEQEPNQDIISDIEYLITAFEAGADADDYWLNISDLRDDLTTLKNQVSVQKILEEFPLLDDEGLDEEVHHCEWVLHHERKRLHAMLSKVIAQPEQNEQDAIIDEPTAAAVMPNGVCVSNVYDDFEAGRASVIGEQEPVAWCQLVDGKVQDLLTSFEMKDWIKDDSLIPLYTSPPKRELMGDGNTADGFRANKKATHADSYWAGVNDAEKHHSVGVE
jgi:hypothetical protein